MKLFQLKYNEGVWEDSSKTNGNYDLVNFVLVVGERSLLEQDKNIEYISSSFPNATTLFCSSSFGIQDNYTYQNSILVTAIEFEKTSISYQTTNISLHEDNVSIGKHLASSIPHDNLQYALLISDGQGVNGDDLITGVLNHLPKGTLITGGLANDSQMIKTLVGVNEKPKPSQVSIIGFYGNNLEVGYGVYGGWDRFGAKKTVTKSDKNTLYELDGKSALDIYKEYLGDYAKDLPQIGLFFPIGLENQNGEHIIRTIVSVDEETKSLTFAGNVPEGKQVTFMKSNMDKVIDGASIAAQNAKKHIKNEPDFILMISCLGRQMVLGPRTEEELEVSEEVFEKCIPRAGFYSNGEIAPSSEDKGNAALHNETMTITTFKEL